MRLSFFVVATFAVFSGASADALEEEEEDFFNQHLHKGDQESFEPPPKPRPGFLQLIFGADEDEDKDPPSFYTFFQGEWIVQKTTVFVKSSEQTFDSLLGQYSVAKDVGTQHLAGRMLQNDTKTGEIVNSFSLFLEFESPNSGAFKVGELGNEQTLFTFDFRLQANEVMMSHGEWLGESTGKAYYQFQIGQSDRFMITVMPESLVANEEDTPELQVFVGKKVPVTVVKTFLQQYSLPIMVAVLLLFNAYMSQGSKMNMRSPERQVAVKKKK